MAKGKRLLVRRLSSGKKSSVSSADPDGLDGKLRRPITLVVLFALNKMRATSSRVGPHSHNCRNTCRGWRRRPRRVAFKRSSRWDPLKFWFTATVARFFGSRGESPRRQKIYANRRRDALTVHASPLINFDSGREEVAGERSGRTLHNYSTYA